MNIFPLIHTPDGSLLTDYWQTTSDAKTIDSIDKIMASIESVINSVMDSSYFLPLLKTINSKIILNILVILDVF